MSVKRDIVVIGGSAGGIDALCALVARLPVLPDVCFLVVVHVPASARSVLPQILSRAGAMSATHAVDGAPLVRGGIVVAPPDHHLVVQGDRVRLTQGPRENSHRPCIDVLFRSVARWWGPQVIGVVLSGVLDDGTAGMVAVKARGGLAVVQSPHDALYSPMPQSVVDHVPVDDMAAADMLAGVLVERLAEEIAGPSRAGEGAVEPDVNDDKAPEMHSDDDDALFGARKEEIDGPASGYTCPDCHGALWEVRGSAMLRYRCRTGHAFSPESLLASQDESVEEAMWAAYRALEESAGIARRLAHRSRERGLADVTRRYEEREQDAIARAQLVRRALEAALGSGRRVDAPRYDEREDAG